MHIRHDTGSFWFVEWAGLGEGRVHLLPRRASLLHTLALTFAQIRHPMWQTENAIPNPSVRLRVVAGMRPGAAMTLLWLETAGSSRLGLQRAALSSTVASAAIVFYDF